MAQFGKSVNPAKAYAKAQTARAKAEREAAAARDATQDQRIADAVRAVLAERDAAKVSFAKKLALRAVVPLAAAAAYAFAPETTSSVLSAASSGVADGASATADAGSTLANFVASNALNIGIGFAGTIGVLAAVRHRKTLISAVRRRGTVIAGAFRAAVQETANRISARSARAAELTQGAQRLREQAANQRDIAIKTFGSGHYIVELKKSQIEGGKVKLAAERLEQIKRNCGRRQVTAERELLAATKGFKAAKAQVRSARRATVWAGARNVWSTVRAFGAVPVKTAWAAATHRSRRYTAPAPALTA